MNSAFKEHSEKFGTYAMEPGLVNGKAHYSSTFENKKYAIWAEPNGNWILGIAKNRGKNMGYFYAHNENCKCPTWKYESAGNWKSANKGFNIRCHI